MVCYSASLAVHNHKFLGSSYGFVRVAFESCDPGSLFVCEERRERHPLFEDLR